MHILVAGGAGYIGSITVEHLIGAGYQVTVLDNLSKGHRDAVHPKAKLEVSDLSNQIALNDIFQKGQFDAVVHLCASSLVGESVTAPLNYYRNNICNGLNLIETMLKHNVMRFAFSSTAAIFGEPDTDSISEENAKCPLNPYGRTKLYFENLLKDAETAHGLKSVCLRYFNAAGATKERGEDHRPESHLIPLIIDAARGRRESITIFGTDYPTPDGTCIRDYIHVSDLAQAHMLALEYLTKSDTGNQFNLGNGLGFSVREVISSVERISGNTVNVIQGPRRPGDPAILVAASDKARSVLGWKPQYDSLDRIIDSAWNWSQKNPDGYNS